MAFHFVCIEDIVYTTRKIPIQIPRNINGDVDFWKLVFSGLKIINHGFFFTYFPEIDLFIHKLNDKL